MALHRKYFDKNLVTRLANVRFFSRLVVEGAISGLHKSPFKGFNVEFAEHRPYIPGDDLRDLDWKLLARFDRYYIRQYEEETNLRAYIVIDSSNSMNYTSHSLSKYDYAAYMAATLTYIFLKQQDAIGLVSFDKDIKTYLPARSSPTHADIILKALEENIFGEDTDIAMTLHSLAERIKRRGVIFVLSDLLDDPHKILMGLKHFRHKKHEVVVFHILDPMELKPDFKGEFFFEDLETKERVLTNPGAILNIYTNLIKEHINILKKGCVEGYIEYYPVNTVHPYSKILMDFFARRLNR